jgi:F-type H+-transporting ATPase subunit b
MSTPAHEPVAVVASPTPEHAAQPQLMDVSPQLMILTWITFIMLAILLYKMAWKPILKALDMREKAIRRSLAEAEKARADAAAADEHRKRAVEEAQAESRRILADARATAADLARSIESRAQKEAQTIVESARREVESAVGRAREELRRECVEIALSAASQVIRHNVDDVRNRELVQAMVRES